ncbi:mycofactocin precursor MftA [Streptomyces sp. 5K101]
MQDEIRTAAQDDDTVGAAAAWELTEELLVEEVSIDGMCGVY